MMGETCPDWLLVKWRKKGEADRKIHYKSLPVALESPAGTHRLFSFFFNICAPLFLGASNYFFLLLKKTKVQRNERNPSVKCWRKTKFNNETVNSLEKHTLRNCYFM